MRLTKKQREEVKARFSGRCAYCGDLLKDRWHADHLEPVMRTPPTKRASNSGEFGPIPEEVRNLLDKGNGMQHPERDTMENLYPACVPCNLFKGGMPLESFREEIGHQLERARKTSVNFRTAERFGLLLTVTNPRPVKFYFERLESG